MKSYSAYFVRTDDPEALRAKLGRVDSRSVEPVAGSAWVSWSYRPDDGPPRDDYLWGRASITEGRSAKLGEVIYLWADTRAEAFVYEHARDGALLRKLVWFPVVDDDGTPGWLCAQGEPEPWETALFRPESLDGVLAEERDRLDERGQGESFPAREAAVRRIWEERRIEARDTVPRADGTVALLVEAHFGLVRPERKR